MDLGLGIVLVVVGGVMEGLFSLPVTRTPRWQWENTWGAGSLMALLLVPWPVALLTVPELRGVYADVGLAGLAVPLLFGLGWGLGGIFWGKAIAAVGVALGVSLLMGLITIFGSPVLLAIREPDKLREPGGLVLVAAVVVMIAGVVVCAWAGRLRQRELEGSAAGGTNVPLALGLLFCLVSGVLSALVNFGFVFGKPIAEAAVGHGASAAAKANAIWALVFTGNFLVNAGYAFWLMARRRTLGLLVKEGGIRYWAWAVFMGVTWPLGIVLFGIGSDRMGTFGPYVAFPMMLVVAVLFGNLAGVLTGEWRGTSWRTRATMIAGVAVLLLAFGVFGWSSRLLGG
ncbi:MAG: hypothetical protein JW809_18930 [Pirellulales bacterium]|nr:hypothetical protein [Pirellulales bacterium]